MTGQDPADYTVLVVDDDQPVLDRLSSLLEPDYTVLTATDGKTALVKAEEADVVLLDRRLPDISGDEVAATINDRLDGPMIAMISGVEPGTDILDLACDDYLVKPLGGDEVARTVDRLHRRAEYDDRLAEYASLASKRAVIESAVPMDELLADDNYDELCRRSEDLRQNLNELMEGFEPADFEAAFQSPEFKSQ